jgi:oxygen-independent coproporphyrinogen-3 oxidase
MEVTIECNPDDLTEDFAALLSQLPVNRVSMGAQTFSDERLHFLHRRHTAAQIPLAVERLRHAGIRNISIDLMYGFPDETLDNWHHDIDQALTLGVEHLSAYALMYEEGTPLYSLLQQGRVKEVDEELSLQMYSDLIDRLQAAGYEHYEISNFAKPGYRSRHNGNYWNQTPYIGLGAAAHSYNGTDCRRWNAADIRQYIEGIEQGRPAYEQEHLDGDTRYNDLVMTALRTCEGLDLAHLSAMHRDYSRAQSQRFVNDGLLVERDGHLQLTRRGLFVSNMIMGELMKV